MLQANTLLLQETLLSLSMAQRLRGNKMNENRLSTVHSENRITARLTFIKTCRLEQAIALVKSSTGAMGSSSSLSIVLRSGREGRVYAITLPRGNSSSGEGATRGSMKDDNHPSQVTSLVTSRAFEREPDKPKPESVPWLRSEVKTPVSYYLC